MLPQGFTSRAIARTGERPYSSSRRGAANSPSHGVTYEVTGPFRG
ncbi:hypothetical protein SALCHL_001708 [Streptomyces albus subsp. chlorinus]|nr:hypothetical protein [Streptomyces albus]